MKIFLSPYFCFSWVSARISSFKRQRWNLPRLLFMLKGSKNWKAPENPPRALMCHTFFETWSDVSHFVFDETLNLREIKFIYASLQLKWQPWCSPWKLRNFSLYIPHFSLFTHFSDLFRAAYISIFSSFLLSCPFYEVSVVSNRNDSIWL